MLPRILLLLLVFTTLYYLLNYVFIQVNKNTCENCRGRGQWSDTRGDLNHCKTCDGSGRKG